jgi:hypothetical protein
VKVNNFTNINKITRVNKPKSLFDLFCCLFVWWCLTPRSTICQLYRGKNHWQTLSHNVVYLALVDIRTPNTTVKVNNFTNINKNEQLSLTSNHWTYKNHDICRWKFRFSLQTYTKMWHNVTDLWNSNPLHLNL